MSSALANRFVHLSFDVDLGDWVNWALGRGIRPEVVAFLRFRPELLHSFDPARGEKSFPSPRTWEFVSDLMSADGRECEAELIQGAVGEGAGVEFLGFLRMFRDLPDIDGLVKDPLGSVVPSGPAALYAVCSALARRVSSVTFGAVLSYVDRLQAEYQALFIKDVIRVRPEVQSTAAFINWGVKNSWLLKG
jgi:hypothetical protein